MAKGPAIVDRASEFLHRIAIVDAEGEHTYAEVLDASAKVASGLLQGRDDLNDARICFQVPPGFTYVAVQWGIWRAGGIAVPLALSHPMPELEYAVKDADPEVIIASGAGEGLCRAVAERRNKRFVDGSEMLVSWPPMVLPTVAADRPAMMIYTSGTTGRPRGVITTHANISAQVESLVNAWDWAKDDRILLVLPLDHVHGVINVVACALWSGATCEMPPAFDADATWDAIASWRLTVFMAVPTIYRKLIAAYEAADPRQQKRMRDGARDLRLMVSGSSALPVQTLERWREITGQTLLERYGMTEIGMALSNPLKGERRPGFVGTPLPSVEVRRVDEHGGPVADDVPGEVEVRGPTVFREYWGKPDATREAFRDGWFRTGDTAVVDKGSYRLLGRSSVDILKTGGYKVSALEIEEVLREHPAIAECAVVGIADEEWGQRVCVGVEARGGAALTRDELVAWAKTRLASYKVPRDLRLVESLPRNAMGKVVKPEVARLFA
jgi:malonyl-CoA/methylmalonyl-CoA synthetase